jgi:hypothetical protein
MSTLPCQSRLFGDLALNCYKLLHGSLMTHLEVLA